MHFWRSATAVLAHSLNTIFGNCLKRNSACLSMVVFVLFQSVFIHLFILPVPFLSTICLLTECGQVPGPDSRWGGGDSWWAGGRLAAVGQFTV